MSFPELLLTQRSLTIEASDGYPLGATLYEPAEHPINACVVVAGGTGVPQRFYRRFAKFFCQRGFSVLTFDYRGVGASRPQTLKGFKMNYLDWGRLDLAAAIDFMHTPDKAMFVVGHSYGGHAMGLAPNHDLVTGFYSFGSGAGWAGWMSKAEACRVRLLWNVILPLLVALKGYMPWSLLGMGEDLPLDVYRQWKAWCKYPRYFFDDPEMAYLKRDFAKVRRPMVALTSTDDPWAPPKSRDAFMEAYKGASVELVNVTPERLGKSIGHMGYFRADAKPLWDDLYRWVMSLTDVPSGQVWTECLPS
jgi:predicted alpha/beta hydrolase